MANALNDYYLAPYSQQPQDPTAEAIGLSDTTHHQRFFLATTYPFFSPFPLFSSDLRRKLYQILGIVLDQIYRRNIADAGPLFEDILTIDEISTIIRLEDSLRNWQSQLPNELKWIFGRKAPEDSQIALEPQDLLWQSLASRLLLRHHYVLLLIYRPIFVSNLFKWSHLIGSQHTLHLLELDNIKKGICTSYEVIKAVHDAERSPNVLGPHWYLHYICFTPHSHKNLY